MNFRGQKGFTGVEIVTSIIILIIFISLITTIFFNIYLNFTDSKRNSMATAYATQISEIIDKMYYSELTSQELEARIEELNIPSGYVTNVTVTNYNEGDVTKKDLVKTVNITVSYIMGKNIKSINIERIKAKEILITPNKPKIADGMAPVKYVYIDKESGEGYWQIVSQNDSTWYNYENKNWANVMLLDGLTVEGGIKVTNSNKEGLAGKKVETLGSMFVWIPRYAYKILSGENTLTAGEIDITFLYSTSDCYIDENGDMANISNKPGYKIHPAFRAGSKTNYANGEWDKEITGIWVAKFEASSTNPAVGASYGGGDTTALNVKVLPNVTSWRHINVSNMFTVCKAMTDGGNIYGLNSTNTDSHMMKNSEWGAMAYLVQSKYGNMQILEDSESGIWNNNYHNGDGYYTTLTGVAGASRDASTANGTLTTTYYKYNTTNGQKGSTTRNIYGIYDVSGGAWEYVVGYLTQVTSSAYVGTFNTKEEKYVTKYAGSSSDRQTNYNANTNIYGDAVHETSSSGAGGQYSWNGDYSYFLNSSDLFFARGGATNNGSSAGVFYFHVGSGGTGSSYGFRPVIIVE